MHSFIRAHTRLRDVDYLPGIRLHLADEAIELWEKTEAERGQEGLPPPFWAFAWAGGLGLARHLIKHPELVQGKKVLDLAAGCGLVAIAAARAGAASVVANEIDEFAGAAIALNAEANAVPVEVLIGDVLDTTPEVDVVLAGDIFYSRPMTERMLPFLRRAPTALVGDPGRAYAPTGGFELLARYEVPVTRSLEDADTKLTAVLRAVRSADSGTRAPNGSSG